MNRHLLARFSTLALILISMDTIAETLPPKSPFEATPWKATMIKKPSTGVLMGSFRISFEMTTLDDVRNRLSVGIIARHGDAGESVLWLCYTNISSNSAERIWIISGGEMGGSEHAVTGISAEYVQIGSATNDCPALPEKMKPVSLDSKLWLGMPLTDVRATLGTPSGQNGPWRSYDYQGKRPGNCESEGFDVLNWAFFRFEEDRVNSLGAGQVTSC